MQEACAFKLHNTFLVSVLFNTHGRGTIINPCYGGCYWKGLELV